MNIVKTLRTMLAGDSGAAGIETFPAAAAAGNGVSAAEVIRYIQETQLGTFTNTGGTATLGGILGDLRALAIGTRFDSMRQTVEKTQTLGAGAATPLFTVTGGPVYCRVIGIVSTILAGTSNGTLQATTTAPAGTTALSTTVAIDDDAAGTSYRFVGATGVLTPVTAGAKIVDPVTVADCMFLVPIGNINFLTSGALTGAIKWYCTYEPLSPLSRIVAA